MKQGNVRFYVCGLLFGLGALLGITGCVLPGTVETEIQGQGYYQRKKVVSQFQYATAGAFPSSVSPGDRRAIEEVVGVLTVAGEPVVVRGVFDLEKQNLSAHMVLYRTDQFDFVVVKDWQKVWRLSYIALAPEPSHQRISPLGPTVTP